MSVILYLGPGRRARHLCPGCEPCDPFRRKLTVSGALEIDSEVIFLEPSLGDRPHLPDSYPDTYAIPYIGYDRYIEAYRVYPQSRTEDVNAHAAGMAWKLQGSDPLAQVLVIVSLNLLDPLLDAMEVPQDQPPGSLGHPEVRLLNPHPDCLAEITVEYPYLQDRYEAFRQGDDPGFLEKPRVQMELLKDAEVEGHQREAAPATRLSTGG